MWFFLEKKWAYVTTFWKVNFIETGILLKFYRNKTFLTKFPLPKTFLLKLIFTIDFKLCIFRFFQGGLG